MFTSSRSVNLVKLLSNGAKNSKSGDDLAALCLSVARTIIGAPGDEVNGHAQEEKASAFRLVVPKPMAGNNSEVHV